MKSTEQTTHASERFDVREIPCSIKHGQIMEKWQLLEPGCSFVLVNDHDPIPLYYQFSAMFPGEFDWSYEERGPEVFAVRITRLEEGERGEPTFRPEAGAPTRCGHEPAGGVGTSEAVDVDARGLEPPEPMMRILSALSTLPSRKMLRALTDRKPVHLIAELESQKYHVASEEKSDGSWLNSISRA